MSANKISLRTTPLLAKKMPSFVDFSPKSQVSKKGKKTVSTKRANVEEKPAKMTRFADMDDDFVEPMDSEDCKPAKFVRRKKLTAKIKTMKTSGNLNADELEPTEADELAVNPRKVAEVRTWMESKILMEKGPKLLLITGPCGSAKTATVKTLCDELNIDVIEAEHQDGEYDQENLIFEKGDKAFYSFIKSCEYSSVEAKKNSKRLLIIEHIPTVFYTNPNKLKDILKDFVSTRTMIVIIMSTIENCWDLSPSRILPDTTLQLLGMHHIKFNAVAMTYMKRALKRVFILCDTKVSDACMNDIISSADGDIRAAMNTIKFSSSDKTISTQLTSAINHLSTFHFVGKVMYSKRAEGSCQNWRIAENKLVDKKWIRPTPPKDDLNYLIEVSRFSENKLADYVFEHEPNFCPSLKAGARVLRDLCELDAAVNQVEFQLRPVVDHYLAEVTIRSTMFNNYDPHNQAVKKKMYTFQKPKIWDLRKATNDKKVQLLKTLPGLRSPDLFTSTIPLLIATKFDLMPEEKIIVDSLGMKSLVTVPTASSTGLIKFNPRPNVVKKDDKKKQERSGIYLKPSNVSKLELEIDDASDIDW